MNNETYNGWTNYETWRVHLEWIDNALMDDIANAYMDQTKSIIPTYELALEIEAFVMELFEDRDQNDFMPYAYYFLRQVNWYEIAENYQRYADQRDADNHPKK